MLRSADGTSGRQGWSIAEAITATDFVRRSPAGVGGRAGHKEWQHFAILAPDVDLLVNFSLCDDLRPGVPPGTETPRIVVVLRDRHGWDGDIENYDPAEAVIRGGAIDLDFAGNRLRFDRTFQIDVALRDRPVRIALELTPQTMPAFVPSIPMIDGPPLNWVVVPRLAVRGSLTVGDRHHVLDGASAYHDHNWGHFLWGHDVAWEWAFVLPEDPAVPWCITFVRLTNRRRTRALAHKMLVWKRSELVRVFREAEVRGDADLAHLRTPSPFKVPRPLALAVPEALTDVPARTTIVATSGDDRVECRTEPYDVAQVLIPSETELGVTIFNEVSARTTVRGRIDGTPLDFTGRSIMEFIRYA